MEEAAADGEGKQQSSSFRWWADAARYAVASVVTILIVAVVVKAVMVLPQPLYLSVLSPQGGSTLFSWNKDRPEELSFYFGLWVTNPSGHVQTYCNMTVYIFSNDTSPWWSSNPENDSMFHFKLGSETFRQKANWNALKHVELRSGVNVKPSDFDVLLSEATRTGIVTELTLRVDGRLSTGPVPEGYPSPSTAGRWTSFFCRPLFAGGNVDDDTTYKEYAFCVSGRTPRRA